MRDRVSDYVILLAVSAALTLPNLGATSLWDMDEAVNAQAAREMRDASTWVIPTFNFQLRTAKPAMLYWLQHASYSVFGVSEWSARLPSVLAAWLVVLVVYELARRMFDRGTGLCASLVLVSVLQFAMLSHAATPDATLLLFTMLGYLAFWLGHGSGGRHWWIPMAAACGLAMLTKGPIGVVLPGLVICSYFAWNRELGRLLDRRLLWAVLVFVLVAGPWYALVAGETRGDWVKAFIANENVGRFLTPMEQHGGGPGYYPVALLALFAPWSAFIGATLWYGVKGTRSQASPGREPGGAEPQPPDSRPGLAEDSAPPDSRPGLAEDSAPPDSRPGLAEDSAPPDSRPGLAEETRAHRFLICWFAAYLVFFSIAATKLPNYIFPLTPALAILTARFLILWRRGTLIVPRWLVLVGSAAMASIGIVFGGSLLYAGQEFPGLAPWGLLGLVLVAGAGGTAWCLRHGNRNGALTAAIAASVAFVGLTAALTPMVVDRQKAPRELARASGADDPGRDLRVASFEWFEPSVVFYTGRKVEELSNADAAIEFLAVPTPAYLFVPASAWEAIAARVTGPHRIAARHFDFLKNCDVLVIANEAPRDVVAK